MFFEMIVFKILANKYNAIFRRYYDFKRNIFFLWILGKALAFGREASLERK